MVPGHLTEKNGFYYMVLNYTEKETGKRKQPWFKTGLPVKGNKKKAENMLNELRCSFVIPTVSNYDGDFSPNMLFSDFMKVWFEIERHSVSKTTIGSYQYNIMRIIVPYFETKGIKLIDLKARHLQKFYLDQLNRVKASTVKKYHANIHKALKYAVKMDLIPSNESEKVELPKCEKHTGKYFNGAEMKKFLEVTKDHKFALLFQLDLFYGLRKSELIGLKWDAIDFDNNTITIKHTVVDAAFDGKRELIMQDKTKTASSYRTLPLIPEFKAKLIALKEQQENNKKLCGDCYCNDYKGYVFVDPMGKLYRPKTVTESYKDVLKKYGFDYVNFHGMRHSCASLMVANGEQMKVVQEWLGHSDIGTTANIYSHLDYTSKVSAANIMQKALPIPTNFKNESRV